MLFTSLVWKNKWPPGSSSRWSTTPAGCQWMGWCLCIDAWFLLLEGLHPSGKREKNRREEIRKISANWALAYVLNVFFIFSWCPPHEIPLGLWVVCTMWTSARASHESELDFLSFFWKSEKYFFSHFIAKQFARKKL